ncbi:RNA 2',3'-cyclic phosphodiesterase [Candidatus Parcubacteria bacterium]|nr:MAG: RNA 2',3'-cyclic phosphodiesterase [Candidatus Parcubacteria bacterium]
MENLRLFISLPVDPALSRAIFKQFKNLALPWEKMKASEPEQLHLTIKFLGDLPLENLPKLINVLQGINPQISDIELQINGPVIFNDKRPQILALKVASNPKLQKLFEAIDQTLFSAGIANKEIRKFSAHLTLARIKTTAAFEEFKSFQEWNFKGTFSTSYFELQQSELSRTGPEYTVLQTFDL